MSETAKNRLMFVIAVALAVIYLFPLYWMYITALKTGSAMFATPPSFWPAEPQWDVFKKVWEGRNVGRYLWNSLLIAIGAVTLITLLGTGEALVSTLEGKGAPSMVERTLIRPPSARIGPLTDEERRKLIRTSPVAGQYDEDIDRESAFEILTKKAEAAVQREAPAEPKTTGTIGGWTLPGFGTDDEAQPEVRQQKRSGYQRETVMEAAMKSAARSAATAIGAAIVRGILGSLSGRRR